MKKNKIYMWVLFIFFNIAIISFSASYNITDLDIVADLQKDGSMEVQEIVTYDIEDINGILFDIDAKGFGELKYIDILEDAGQKNGEYKFKRVNSSKYEISLSDGLYKIKLYSKNKNKIRKFVFIYTLTDAITVYNDIAQLNRKMVGQNWQQNIDNINIKINVPVTKNYDNSKILVFGHGPLAGEVDKIENTAIYKLKNYYPGNFLEAHILMEPEIFSNYDNSKIITKDMKQKLLDMEARLADDANRKREKLNKREEILQKFSKNADKILKIEASIFIALIGYIYIVFRRKNKPKNNGVKYLRELPNDFSPALVGGFMTKSVDKNEILSTIVDLIRRKVLALEVSDNKTTINLIGNTDELSKQEKIIVDIYMNDFGDGKSLDLNGFSSFHQVPMNVARKFEKWSDSIYDEISKKGLVYERMGYLPMAILIIISIIFSVGGLIQTIFTNNPLFILAIPLGIILLISSTIMTKYPSKKLSKARAEWQAFKNFISDYSQLEEAKISSIYLWEQYFVYAIALGVSDKVVKAYKKALDMGTIVDADTMNNFAYSPIFNRSFNNSFNSLNSLTGKTYSKANSTISSSRMSSSSGRGGGFSSGSSGGGGSRGGGGAF